MENWAARGSARNDNSMFQIGHSRKKNRLLKLTATIFEGNSTQFQHFFNPQTDSFAFLHNQMKS